MAQRQGRNARKTSATPSVGLLTLRPSLGFSALRRHQLRHRCAVRAMMRHRSARRGSSREARRRGARSQSWRAETLLRHKNALARERGGGARGSRHLRRLPPWIPVSGKAAREDARALAAKKKQSRCRTCLFGHRRGHDSRETRAQGESNSLESRKKQEKKRERREKGRGGAGFGKDRDELPFQRASSRARKKIRSRFEIQHRRHCSALVGRQSRRR